MLILLGGKSAVGKTTLIANLIRLFPILYTRPISYTTRAPRQGEDRSEFNFVTEEQLLNLWDTGKLANFDRVYGECYGIDKASIESTTLQGNFALKEVHPKNHIKFKNDRTDIISMLMTDETGSSKSRETNREGDDADFYKLLKTDDFDFVVDVGNFPTDVDLARHVDIAIRSISRFKGQYPPVKEINTVNADGYSKIANEFTDDKRQTTANFHQLSKRYFCKTFKEMTNANSKLRCLEIGPGTGWFRNAVSIDGLDYTAVDISAKMVTHCLTNDVVCNSASFMPFKSGVFDVIVCSLGDPYFFPQAMLEMARVLKAGGKLLFSAPSSVWAAGVEGRTSSKTKFISGDGTNIEVFSFVKPMEKSIELLSHCGFKKIRGIEISGAEFLPGTDISPAITLSANQQNIDLSKLRIVDFIVATAAN